MSLIAHAWDGTGAFTNNIANLTKTGTGGVTPFDATPLTATGLVNSAHAEMMSDPIEILLGALVDIGRNRTEWGHHFVIP